MDRLEMMKCYVTVCSFCEILLCSLFYKSNKPLEAVIYSGFRTAKGGFRHSALHHASRGLLLK